MISDIELLIHILNKINSDKSIEIYNRRYSVNHTLVRAAIYLANQTLITDDAEPNINNMNKIINIGFSVFPGELDSYGWVTGCIELDDGIILFG